MPSCSPAQSASRTGQFRGDQEFRARLETADPALQSLLIAFLPSGAFVEERGRRGARSRWCPALIASPAWASTGLEGGRDLPPGQTSPVAFFGAIGLPIIICENTTELPLISLVCPRRAYIIVAALALPCPPYMVVGFIAGWKGLRGVLAGRAGLPACLRDPCGGGVHLLGPELTDVLASIARPRRQAWCFSFRPGSRRRTFSPEGAEWPRVPCARWLGSSNLSRPCCLRTAGGLRPMLGRAGHQAAVC